MAIAKMDGTENELEDLVLKGFPTIKLYRRETNEIRDYSSREYFLEIALYHMGHSVKAHSYYLYPGLCGLHPIS